MSGIEAILERIRLRYLRAMIVLCDLAANVQMRCFEVEELTLDERNAIVDELDKLRRDRHVLQLMLDVAERQVEDALRTLPSTATKAQ